MSIERVRLLSLIEFAQQSARLRSKPAATVTEHGLFARYEHQMQGLPGIRMNVNDAESEGEIRRKIIEADLVDCMVALPGQLFYSTPIPVCLWFLARSKKNGRFRDRRGETLFIDARKLGALVDRVHRDLTDEDVAKIGGAYHAWRGDLGAGEYVDVPGFCKAAALDDIRKHGHVLTPGRYVGAEAAEEDEEPFEDKMKRLAAELEAQFAESARLETAIRESLGSLGFGR